MPVQPRLTPAGRTHPFFQGLADRDGEPPPLRGYNVSGPARPGAVVLAEVPLGDGQSQPLIVLGRYGDGRVLSVLTDSLWDWAFAEAGRGRGNRAYLAFVRQAVRWSIGDPQLQPLKVEPERVRLAPGDPIRARIRVLGEDFLPSARTELSVTLRGPGGESRALVPTLEAPGVYRVEALAAGEGSWEIAAAASTQGRDLCALGSHRERLLATRGVPVPGAEPGGFDGAACGASRGVSGTRGDRRDRGRPWRKRSTS